MTPALGGLSCLCLPRRRTPWGLIPVVAEIRSSSLFIHQWNLTAWVCHISIIHLPEDRILQFPLSGDYEQCCCEHEYKSWLGHSFRVRFLHVFISLPCMIALAETFSQCWAETVGTDILALVWTSGGKHSFPTKYDVTGDMVFL